MAHCKSDLRRAHLVGALLLLTLFQLGYTLVMTDKFSFRFRGGTPSPFTSSLQEAVASLSSSSGGGGGGGGAQVNHSESNFRTNIPERNSSTSLPEVASSSSSGADGGGPRVNHSNSNLHQNTLKGNSNGSYPEVVASSSSSSSGGGVGPQVNHSNSNLHQKFLKGNSSNEEVGGDPSGVNVNINVTPTPEDGQGPGLMSRLTSFLSRFNIFSAEFWKPLCSPTPSHLLGPLRPNLTAPNLTSLSHLHRDLSPSGYYTPATCTPRSQALILIPVRNRETHLLLLLQNLIPILKRQQLAFHLFVIEQVPLEKNQLFNKAMLLNAGFVEALKFHPQWNCTIFHDVDKLPENDRVPYNCSSTGPKHLLVAHDGYKYKLPYENYVGGVVVFTNDQFRRINGFSNSYWGWGGEDDDMARRLEFHGMKVERPALDIGRYTTIKHEQSYINPMRFVMVRNAKKRFAWDGLSNLNYTVVEILPEKLFTRIRVLLRVLPDPGVATG